jgi:cell surface protein (putative penicillin-binding protein)
VKRRHLLITGSLIIGIMIVVLCSCDLINKDEEKFNIDENNCLTKINLDKTGPNVIIPEKVVDKVINNIYISDAYFSKIESLDVSKVSELEKFKLDIPYEVKESKLKTLDFSRNEKLKDIFIDNAIALDKIVFNKKCESITLRDASVENMNLKPLKKLSLFSYFNGPLHNIDFSCNTELDYLSFYYSNVKKLDLSKLKKLTFFQYVSGPLEELDISNNPNLESLEVYGTNVKVLDISKNHKLRFIQVDEGTQIIGEINPGAEIRYWTKEDVKELRSKLLDD